MVCPVHVDVVLAGDRGRANTTVRDKPKLESHAHKGVWVDIEPLHASRVRELRRITIYVVTDFPSRHLKYQSVPTVQAGVRHIGLFDWVPRFRPVRSPSGVIDCRFS